MNTIPIIKPKIGSVWKHHSGRVYLVYDVTNENSDRQDRYPTTISYRNILNGTKWSRKLDDWYRSFTPVPGNNPTPFKRGYAVTVLRDDGTGKITKAPHKITRITAAGHVYTNAAEYFFRQIEQDGPYLMKQPHYVRKTIKVWIEKL